MARSLFVALLFTLPAVLADGHRSLVSHKQLAQHRGSESVAALKDAVNVVVAVAAIGSTGIPPQGPSSISATPTTKTTTSKLPPKSTKTDFPSPTGHGGSQTSNPTSTGSPAPPTQTSHSTAPGHAGSTAPPTTATLIPPPPPAGGGEATDPSDPTSSTTVTKSDRPTHTSSEDSAPTSSEVFPDNDACSADSDCGSGSSCCFFNDFANVCVAADQCSVKGACRFAGQSGSCGARGPDRCFENSDCGPKKPICCSFSDIGNICIKANACTTGQCLSATGNDIGTCDNPEDDSSSSPACFTDSDCPGRKVCCDFGGAEPSQCIRLTACVHDACRSTSGRYGGCDSG
ncbi:hypothetical protein AURDEDRAFT_167458 [Auricularia subglabra TFB-10046 SS5]|nr:hypothetical protein AURDEDRAFT_167458 [Auricularia subglabra TFB-10046 SS5]